MAKSKKRADGLQQQCFRIDGRRYVVYGRNAAEIASKRQKKTEEVLLGIEKRKSPTLRQYYEHFTEQRKDQVKAATLRTQQMHFNACAAVVIDRSGMKFGDLKIQDITPKDCETVRNMLKGSSRTVNDRLAHLSHVFKAAVLDETILRNPCRAIKPIRRTEPPSRKTKHRALTPEETERFFAAAESSYYLECFKLMIQTGLRIGEVAAIQNSDVDYLNNCIHISKTVTRDEQHGYQIGQTTKTESGKRDIPMNDSIKDSIKAQKERNRTIFRNVLQMDGLLFRSPEGRLIREDSVNREVKRICAAAGIEYFTCHGFRATFATRFIEQRPQDYKVLSEILGHSNTKITLDLYTHVMKESKVKAIENINIAM